MKRQETYLWNYFKNEDTKKQQMRALLLNNIA